MLEIHHIEADIPIEELDHFFWQNASEIVIDSYWSGEKAPAGRHFRARLLWSGTALYVRFDVDQSEPLVVNEHPDVTKKTNGLWERDVCEIFIAPDTANRERYFEFEVEPTGEWIDLVMEVRNGERITDIHYKSEMLASARIERDRVIAAMKIPWTAFGQVPTEADVWAGNIFRCVGTGPERGYLAWNPTKTAKPDFHVPSAFGELLFARNG